MTDSPVKKTKKVNKKRIIDSDDESESVEIKTSTVKNEFQEEIKSTSCTEKHKEQKENEVNGKPCTDKNGRHDDADQVKISEINKSVPPKRKTG